MDPDAATLDHIEALLRGRQWSAAELAAREFTLRRPARAEGHILLGRSLQLQGNIAGALSAVEAAEQRAPRHPAALLLHIECLLQTGEGGRALRELHSLETDAADQPRVLQDVGGLYSHLNLHGEAERCYARAAMLRPRDPQALYNWATCLIALGRLDEADRALTRVIELAPNDHDAYYNRSTLRRQTVEFNHVSELEQALARPGLAPAATVALGYAMAKEFEDLGSHAKSFDALKRAADTRRSLLSYRVEDDVATMQEIARQFGAGTCGADARGQRPGHADARPIFILGLPRSGTTLVDRILSSHSQVQSRGESSDLAAAVMHLAGPAPHRQELIRRAAQLDVAAVGRNYCARLPAAAGHRVVDKTPMNFLYVGLIAAALPNARIIHVRRSPVDVCYAMYKTLFRMAYPFSYDLQDLSRYHLAYAALMQHWREVCGDRMIELDYEDLVADQAAVTQRLLESCGLPWEDSCLEFHRNQSPSLTASAAQVRRPIYNSSVGLWRRYEAQLKPLIDALGAGREASP